MRTRVSIKANHLTWRELVLDICASSSYAEPTADNGLDSLNVLYSRMDQNPQGRTSRRQVIVRQLRLLPIRSSPGVCLVVYLGDNAVAYRRLRLGVARIRRRERGWSRGGPRNNVFCRN